MEFPSIRPANRDETLDFNLRWIRELADRAARADSRIAIGNMFDFDRGRTITYGKNADESLDLIDAADRGNVAVCLDTGHANVVGHDPAAMARAFGDRLKVLHVHDNDGRSDQHVAPFVGSIDWPAFTAALRDIGFEGVFSLEIHHQVQRMPPDIIDDAVRLALRIARHITESG